jgi:hypothetical protein
MSIDWLFHLEKSLEFGKEFYACQGTGKNQWIISKDKEQLKEQAQAIAKQKGMPVSIYQLRTKSEGVQGCFYLVPLRIEESGPKGEPMVLWSLVETKDAAEMIRDLRFGPSPYFAAFEVETIKP